MASEIGRMGLAGKLEHLGVIGWRLRIKNGILCGHLLACTLVIFLSSIQQLSGGIMKLRRKRTGANVALWRRHATHGCPGEFEVRTSRPLLLPFSIAVAIFLFHPIAKLLSCLIKFQSFSASNCEMSPMDWVQCTIGIRTIAESTKIIQKI